MNDDFDIDPVAARAPQSWIEALEESRADAAAGRFVDADVVHRRFRSIYRTEAGGAKSE